MLMSFFIRYNYFIQLYIINLLYIYYFSRNNILFLFHLYSFPFLFYYFIILEIFSWFHKIKINLEIYFYLKNSFRIFK